MDINTLRTAITLLGFVVFVGILIWAYLPSHREGFERAGELPFADDEVMQPTDAAGRITR